MSFEEGWEKNEWGIGIEGYHVTCCSYKPRDVFIMVVFAHFK